MQRFVDAYEDELRVRNKPILRTYSVFKSDFIFECHLNSVNDLRYHVAITALRTSSHILEIEHGRYQNYKVPRDIRLCRICNVVDDEELFVTSCNTNHGKRSLLYSKIDEQIPLFWYTEWQRNFFIFNHQQWPTDTNLAWKVSPPVLHNSQWGSYFQREWLRRVYFDEQIWCHWGLGFVAVPVSSTLAALEVVLVTTSSAEGGDWLAS